MNDQNRDEQEYEIAHAMPQTLRGFTHMEINNIAADIINKSLNGADDPAKLYIKLDFLLKALAKAKGAIREDALEELEKYDKQHLMGVEINIGGSTKYDYSHNEEWARIEKRRKEIEKEMQTAAKQDGEMTIDGVLVPPARVKTSSVSVTPKYAKQ